MGTDEGFVEGQNYDILLEAQSADTFVVAVEFLEEGVELTVADKSKQGEDFAALENIRIRAVGQEQQIIYARLQSMLLDFLNEAYIKHREGAR